MLRNKTSQSKTFVLEKAMKLVLLIIIPKKKSLTNLQINRKFLNIKKSRSKQKTIRYVFSYTLTFLVKK